METIEKKIVDVVVKVKYYEGKNIFIAIENYDYDNKLGFKTNCFDALCFFLEPYKLQNIPISYKKKPIDKIEHKHHLNHIRLGAMSKKTSNKYYLNWKEFSKVNDLEGD